MSSNTQVTPVAAIETQLVPVFSATIGGMVMSVCDGRALHAFMEIGKHFASWMTDRIEQYGFQQDQDFLCLSQIRETQRKDGQRGTAKQVDYHLSLDMAKELSMVENNAKGREARRYFIAMERQALPAPVIDPALTPISDRLAHGRFLATFDNNRLHLREIEHDAYVMADHRWPNVIRHEPMAPEVLLDLLDAVAAKLNRRSS